MKLSLLEMVQDILNDLDSDNVNSIDDTVESQQVAQIIKTCYLEMMSNRNWPHQRKLLQLDSPSDVNRPNYLVIPDNVKELLFFNYNKEEVTDGKVEFKEVQYKEPDEFLRFISGRNSENPNTITVLDNSGVEMLIFNNQPPAYWTSFDDTHIVTDSYNAAVETTLRKSKTQCIAYVFDEWVHEDSAIPIIPMDAFSALLEEAKSTAFMNVKQMPNQKAEQKASRQQRWLSRKSWRAKGGVRYDDYGRKGKK